MQSSISGNGIPQRAIDGSTSTFFNPDTCSMTKNDRSPWWYVNLLEPYMVQLVRLDFGTSCCANSRPATIVVRVGNNRPDLGINPICNKYTGFIEEGRPLFLPCTTAMPGAFVGVYLEDPPGNPLSICEAFVYTDQALPIERCPSFRDQPLGSTATYNGKCYVFYNNQPRNLMAARRFCEIRGGNLIDESNPALQGFLSWELFRRHRNDPNGQYWLGAVRDPRSPNNWKWINGQDVSISFWNLPVTNENCSRLDGSKGWLWSDTNCNLNLNFVCQHKPATCGKPERPANSTIIARNFDIGSVIEYRCDPGHLLVGPNIRTCLPSGFFSEFPPKCRYLECGPPAGIPHGSYKLVNGTRHYLGTVQYICNEGHILVGRGSLVCDVDEKWNGPPPRCDPVYCRQPPPILNGQLFLSSNNTVFGTTAKYVCNAGYTAKGRDVITCVASGYWDGDAPVCQPEQTVAETLTSPTSRVSSEITHLQSEYSRNSQAITPGIKLQPSHPSYSEATTTPVSEPSNARSPVQDKRTTTDSSLSHFTSVNTVSKKHTSTTQASTWPIAGIGSQQHPAWTHPPLEIIPANDGDDLENHLDESPSNRIPYFEDAPENRIPEEQPSRQKPPEVTSSILLSPVQYNTASAAIPGYKPTEDLPIITIGDNEPNENTFYSRNGNNRGSVKYGHKNEGKSINSAQAKLNMGGIIALGVFGGFILLAITVTLILIFVRRVH